MSVERHTETSFLEKMALFYYFSFLDEAKAQATTIQTLKKIRQDKKNNSAQETDLELVKVTQHFLNKSKGKTKPVGLAFTAGSILLPEKSNWGPWFEFRKVADERDFQALLYSRILGLSETTIAEGLGAPVGTIRYRLGRALKSLGHILVSSEKSR